MDVGFNNTNRLHEALECEDLKDVVWIVDATSQERNELWKKYYEKHAWEQISSGYGFQITTLDVINKNGVKETLPVRLDFSFAIIDGYKIAFVESNSLLTHYGYVEAFLRTYFQRTHQNYSRWNHTNACNFHNCINYLDSLDKEPRDSIYKPVSYSEYYIFEHNEPDGKYVENLTTLTRSNLIKDQNDRIYIINQIENTGKFVKVMLSEVTDNMCRIGCTLPMACDKNKFFTSPKDKDFKYRFEVIDMTKENVCDLILENIKK